MTKARVLLLSILIALTGGTFKQTKSQCVNQQSTSDMVAIRTVFQFHSKEFRSDWIYRLLEPKLYVPAKGLQMHDSQAIVSEALNATFCVSPWSFPQNSRMSFSFGPRRLEAIARPIIKWRNTEFKDKNGVTLREGEMPIINFLYQPSPDWVVVKPPVWERTDNGQPRLDLEIYNFGNQTHPGASVAMSVIRRDAGVNCAYPNARFATVQVVIRIEKGKVKVLSGDPQSSEPIQRNATIVKRKAKARMGICIDETFSTELGPTGAIGPGESLRIRYAFVDTGYFFFSDVTYWTISVSGDRVFPERFAERGVLRRRY
jgi:hypothetical protein